MNKLAAFNNMPQKQSMSAFANVPRRTEIMGQPHMLSYINPEEEAVLQQMRGGMPPVAGPGGVPSYLIFGGRTGFGSWGDSIADSFSGGSVNTSAKDADMGVGATNTGKTYRGDDKAVIGGFNYSDDNDDKPAVATGSSGYPSLDATAGVNTSHTPGSTLVTIDVNKFTRDDAEAAGLLPSVIDALFPDDTGFNSGGIDVGVPGIDTSYGSGSLVTGGASDSNEDFFNSVNTGSNFDTNTNTGGNTGSVNTSAKDDDLSVGATNTGETYSGSETIVSGGGGDDDTSQLTDAEKEEIVMSQPVVNDDGTLNTNVITPVALPEITYNTPSLDPQKIEDAAKNGLLNVTTIGEASIAVPYPSGVTIDRSGGMATIIDAATGTLLSGVFPMTENPDIDLVAAYKIAFDNGFTPGTTEYEDAVDKILLEDGYSYSAEQAQNNNFLTLGEGTNIILGEDISGAITNVDGQLSLDFSQITEDPFENALNLDISQIQPDETETETEVETETGEVDLSAFGGAGDDVDTGATTGGVDTSSIEGIMQASFGDLLNQDYTDYTESGFQGNDLTEGGNTIGYATSGENVGSAAIVTPEGNVEIIGPGSTETGIVFEGETAVDDAIDYLTGNADAEDVPSGEGETITDTSTLQGVLEASGLLQDIVFNEDGTYSDGDGNIYETAEELIDAINSGSGSDGTGSDAVGVGGEGDGDGDGAGTGEGEGQGDGTGEGQGVGDGTGQGTGDGDGDGTGDDGVGDGDGEGGGTGDGSGNGTDSVSQVADSYRVDQQFAVRDIVDDFNRRRKSGLGYGLPEYMRRYMSGQVIDELVRRVELADGSVFYVTPDGRYLDEKEFIGTKVLGDPQSIKTGEERYQTGYRTTNLRTGETTQYDTDGNPIQT